MREHTQQGSRDRDPVDEDDRLTALLLAVGEGDRTAFEDLYRRGLGVVLGAVRPVVRNQAIAEEVAQEVWLQVWRLADRFDPSRGSAAGWLRTIARRRAVDRVRLEVHGAEREVYWGTRHSSHRGDEVFEQVERSLGAEALRLRVDSLTPLQRQAMTMAYFDGHTYREISRRLRISENTAKSRGREALCRLRSTPELRAWAL